MKAILTVFVVALGATLLAKPALPQPPYLLPKTDPRRYSPHASSMYGRHARDHARLLYHYGRTRQSISRETAQEHLAGVRTNLAASKKEMAKLKTEKAADPQAQKLVASIESHYAKCEQMCTMVETMAAADKPDMEKMCDHCAAMCRELDAALAEHEKLMKILSTEKLEEPPAAATK